MSLIGRLIINILSYSHAFNLRLIVKPVFAVPHRGDQDILLHYTALARTSCSFSIDSLQRKIIRFGLPSRLHCAWRCVWYDTSTSPSAAHPAIHQTTHLHFHPYTHSPRLTNQPYIHLSVCLSIYMFIQLTTCQPTNKPTKLHDIYITRTRNEHRSS